MDNDVDSTPSYTHTDGRRDRRVFLCNLLLHFLFDASRWCLSSLIDVVHSCHCSSFLYALFFFSTTPKTVHFSLSLFLLALDYFILLHIFHSMSINPCVCLEVIDSHWLLHCRVAASSLSSSIFSLFILYYYKKVLSFSFSFSLVFQLYKNQ